MACIMLAGCIAELRVLDDLGVARGMPPTVEEQHMQDNCKICPQRLACRRRSSRATSWHAQK